MKVVHQSIVVSVVIPTYNRSELLSKTLSSLSACGFSKDSLEVIVVDDGSSDDSFRVAQNFSSVLNLIYLFQEDRGYRVARARNLGITVSQGDICIFLDSGIVVPSGFIKAHREAHEGRSNAVVIGNVLGFSHDEETIAGVHRHLQNNEIDTALKTMALNRRFDDLRESCWRACHDDLSLLPAPWALGWSGNISVKRENLAAGIRFDENYQSWGGEDNDFSLQLYQAGATFLLSRKASAIHIPHGKSEIQNSESGKKNKIYLNSKFNLEATQLLIEMKAVDLNHYLIQKYGLHDLTPEYSQ